MCPPRPSSERASYGQFHAPCKAHQQQVLPSTSPCALLHLRDFDQFLEKVDERHGCFWIKRSRTTCASISEHVLCKLRHGVYRELVNGLVQKAHLYSSVVDGPGNKRAR